MLKNSGLSMESLRPSIGSAKGNAIGEIDLDMRLSGTLNQFADFIASLYKLPQFYKIESFTLKPIKDESIQIFLEIKGYYQVNQPTPAGKSQQKKSA